MIALSVCIVIKLYFCGILAEYFNIDSTVVRLIAVILVFGFGTGILAYLAAALIMSDEP